MTPPLPHTLYRAGEVRRLDRIAIEERGIPGIELMNRAGAALFDELRYRWPQARHLLIFCGGGNNGGDGYVVARLAAQAGLDPLVVALADPATLQGDAATAWRQAREAGVATTEFYPPLLRRADLVVDALFGTGLDRPVEGCWAEAIEAINAFAGPVIGVDIPSGLHADSGRVLGTAVRADATVTFIGLKQGMFTADGPDCCGAIRFDDLGVPAAIYEAVPPSARRIDWAGLRHHLPPRPRNSHKGQWGHVLVVGGNHGMAGAARLGAEAALRCGAGLVSVATRGEHVSAMVAARPEVMWHGVEAISDLTKLLQRATVVAIGPGLGRDDWARALLMMVLESGLPLVVDADALNLLAENPDDHHGEWILTPHPGEAARLLGTSTSAIGHDRFAAAAELQRRYGGVTVLKGAGTLVHDGRTVALCSEGNPGMASAGMGDLLTGTIAALVAQGLEPAEAARCGVTLHGAAGEPAAREGQRCLISPDLL